MSRTYDSRCYDLAEHFLSDEPNASEEEREKLAAHIQQAVEGWFATGPERPETL